MQSTPVADSHTLHTTQPFHGAADADTDRVRIVVKGAYSTNRNAGRSFGIVLLVEVDSTTPPDYLVVARMP